MARKPMITASAIDPSVALKSVSDDSAGGTVMFVGTIRNRNEGKAVSGLRYDVYRKMAEKKMLEIESQAKARWPVKKLYMVHRYGNLRVGEVSVVVAVSCEHRAEAFEAARFAIDAIKRTVPLWKKEMSKGRKDRWVRGTPIES